MSAQKPEPSSSGKKPSWWNPSSGSWQSPWSLREDAPPSDRVRDEDPKPSPAPVRSKPAPTTPVIAERKQPEPTPPPALKIAAQATNVSVTRHPSPFDVAPGMPAGENWPGASVGSSNHSLEEPPQHFPVEENKEKPPIPADYLPKPVPESGVGTDNEAPTAITVRRRVAPPKAKAPDSSITDEPTKPAPDRPQPPASKAASPASLPAAQVERPVRPLRPFHEPETDLTLPSQIGEWPHSRNQESAMNVWRRMISFSLLVFAFTVVAWLYWQDDAPPNEVTLQLDRSRDDMDAPSAIGRMKVLLSSVVPIKSSDLAMRPPWSWETRELSQMLDENVSARDNLQDLLEDADWHPRHVGWYEEDLGSHSMWLSLAILKQAEAAYLMRRGEEDAAFAVAIDLAALSRSLQELHAWPSYYERSLFLHEKSCQTLADLLRSSKLDHGRLGGYQEEFARCAPADELLRAHLSASYLFEKKLMLGIRSGEKGDTLPGGLVSRYPSRIFFKANRTLNLFQSSFLELRDQVGRSPWSGSGQIRDRVGRGQQRVGLPNSGGESYFAKRIDFYLDLPGKQTVAHARHTVITTLFALRRFMSREKRLPPKLVNLIPDYLTEIPQDPFSGESLKYSDATGILASVGTNYKSDENKPHDPPLADTNELAVEVVRPTEQ